MILMGMDIPINAVRRQLEAGIDIIVHLGRLRDKSRKVLEIVEITGYENGEIQTTPLYQFIEETNSKKDCVIGSLQKITDLKYTDKLKAAGISL